MMFYGKAAESTHSTVTASTGEAHSMLAPETLQSEKGMITIVHEAIFAPSSIGGRLSALRW